MHHRFGGPLSYITHSPVPSSSTSTQGCLSFQCKEFRYCYKDPRPGTFGVQVSQQCHYPGAGSSGKQPPRSASLALAYSRHSP